MKLIKFENIFTNIDKETITIMFSWHIKGKFIPGLYIIQEYLN